MFSRVISQAGWFRLIVLLILLVQGYSKVFQSSRVPGKIHPPVRINCILYLVLQNCRLFIIMHLGV